MKNHLGVANIATIALTTIMFTIALFTKGFTHDLLIEAAVLLVSIKLILMNLKVSNANEKILSELTELKKLITNK